MKRRKHRGIKKNPASRTFEYYINLDERGEFFADVRNPAGKTVFEIHGFDIFEDGFMRNKNDISGLQEHLVSLKIMKPSDDLIVANPYRKRKLRGKRGRVHARSTTLKKARAQIRLLKSIEKNPVGPEAFFVVDNAFNRENSPELIGVTFKDPPSYTHVVPTTGKPHYQNIAAYRKSKTVRKNPTLPPKNIYWKSIPASAIVHDSGSAFIVATAKGPAVAYWNGQEAVKAQRWLARRAKASVKNPSRKSSRRRIITKAVKQRLAVTARGGGAVLVILKPGKYVHIFAKPSRDAVRSEVRSEWGRAYPSFVKAIDAQLASRAGSWTRRIFGNVIHFTKV